MSGRIKIAVFSCLWMFACSGEQPTPDSFLNYDHPYFQGVNHTILLDLDKAIERGDFGQMHSVIMIRNNNIIFEKYYNGYKRSDLHSIGEGTQSIVSALLGIAMTEDSSIRLDTPLYHMFPDYAQLFENVPQKDKINVAHLLTNTSGFWWQELGEPANGEKNDAFLMTKSNDWISYVLSTPMIREPGHEFNFNSGNAILMAPILQMFTGRELEQFAREKLFEPLDIQWKWDKMPGAYVNTAWGLSMRPVDFAKIGYLYLKRGKWNEKQIFDRYWSKVSTRVKTGASAYYNYSFFWWRFAFYADVNKYVASNDTFFAWGNGGQFLFVIPHLNMVVVLTAGNYNNEDKKAFELLRDYVFAAVAFNSQ